MLQIARLIGILASVGALGLYIVLAFFNPYSPGSLTFPIAAMMLLALVGTLAAWKTKPYLMLAIFLIAFIPMGVYMLGTPGIFKGIGIFDLLYVLASVLMVSEPVIRRWRRKTKSL